MRKGQCIAAYIVLYRTFAGYEVVTTASQVLEGHNLVATTFETE